jgi:hypothetical protein
MPRSTANRARAYSGELQPQQAAAPPPSAAPAQGDVIEQLTKLGALRDQGVLTDEEFAAQKARILGG